MEVTGEMLKAYHGTGVDQATEIVTNGFLGPSHFYVDDQDMARLGKVRELANSQLDMTALELAREWHQDHVVVEVDLEKVPDFTLDWIGQDEGDGGSCWVCEITGSVPVRLLTIHLYGQLR